MGATRTATGAATESAFRRGAHAGSASASRSGSQVTRAILIVLSSLKGGGPQGGGPLEIDPPGRIAVSGEDTVQLRAGVRRARVYELDGRRDALLVAMPHQLEGSPRGLEARVGRRDRGLGDRGFPVRGPDLDFEAIGELAAERAAPLHVVARRGPAGRSLPAVQ